MKNPSKLSRRDVLKALAVGTLAGCATEQGTHSTSSAIQRENAKPGARDWMLTNTRIDPATKYRCPWIEGYSSQTPVRPGKKIEFFVSTNPASSFRLEIFRMGFYNGAGGRKVTELGPFNGATQPDPE